MECERYKLKAMGEDTQRFWAHCTPVLRDLHANFALQS